MIVEKTKFTYQNYLSDLSGIDTKAHENNTSAIIRNIRDWLYTSSRRFSIPGHLTIIEDFTNWQTNLPVILQGLHLEIDSLTFNDLCVIIEEYLKTLLQQP